MTSVNGECRTAADAARQYLRVGIQTVPLAHRSKKPWDFERNRLFDEWERLDLSEKTIDSLFPIGSNIGIRLGVPSGGLVDCDLDCPETRRAAPILLPPTGMIGGRASAPTSHYFFQVAEPPAKSSIEFRDPTSSDLSQSLLLELRSTGGQTVVSPSIYGPEPAKGHLKSEPFVWAKHGTPTRVDIDVLATAIKAVAAAALLGRHWKRSGRHAAALALAGGLRRANVPVEDAERFVRAVCAAANDDETANRIGCVRSTYERPAGGHVVGWPKLIELLGQHGQRVVSAVTAWLGIQPASPPRSSSAAQGSTPKPAIAPFRPLPEWKPFPVEHLPATLREFVSTVSTAMRCDTSYVALPALSVCAGMIGATRTVALKKSWHEPSMTWTAVVGESGTLKTPPFRKALAPVVEMQNEYIRQHAEAYRIYRADLRQHQRDAKKAGANSDPGDPPAEPVCTRIYARDTTIEAMASIIHSNRDRFLVGRDELSGWLASFNQYKSKGGSDLANWLELHGLGTLCVDRKTGEQRALFVSGVGVSLCGGIQPGVLKLALSSQHFSAGIPARLLFAYPPRIPKEWTEDDIDEAVEERYARLIRGLSALLPHTDVEDNRFPVALPLTPEARSEWVRFYRRFAERQTEADGDLAAAFSKLEGYAARLALLHHVCQSVDAGEEALEAVTVESIRAGIALAEWFAYEAERVYQMIGEGHEESEIRTLLARVRRVAFRNQGRVTARNLQRTNRRYRSTDEAAAALEGLVARGLGRWEDVPATTRGGHPTRVFILAPTADTTDRTSDDEPPENGDGEPFRADTTPDAPTQPGGGAEPSNFASDDGSATYTSGGTVSSGVLSVVSAVGSEYGAEHELASERVDSGGGCVGASGVVSAPSDAVPYTLITSPAGVQTLADALSGWVGTVGLDTETTGLNSLTDHVRLIQIAAAGDVAIVDVFELPNAVDDLAPLFAALADKEIVAHNAQFDLRFLSHLGFVPTAAYCTMLASRVLHAGERTDTNARLGHGLGDVLERELDEEIDKTEQRSDWSGRLSAVQLQYAARDVAPLVCTADSLKEKLAAANLTEVANLEMRALLGIAWASPVRLDAPAWLAIADTAKERRATLAAEMDDLAPDPNGLPGIASRNWDSPPQVIEAFAHVGVTIKATDDDTLAGLSHPLAEKLREYRGASKKTNTYGAKWVTKHVDRNGHVLPGWNQLGAESGRMSCSNPNLQQIPRGSDYRRCFVAGSRSRVLVKADYSQIELRIAAKIANESVMIAAYQDGRDLHTLTAARLLGKPEAEVKKADRQLAKAVNFGLLYGMGWRSLKLYAKANYGVTLTDNDAQRYRTAFFETYPALASWHSRVEGQVKALHRKDADAIHETRTLMGRRRFVPVSKRGSDGSPYPNKQDALNTPVQGTGADGLKLAIALLWERRAQCPTAVPVLFCHDEIVLEVPEADAPAAADWLRTNMIEALAETIAPVPVEVEVTTGRTWGG